MAKNYDDIGGVWRTIGGRRVFIKDGQDLASAMIESGKFKNLRSTYRKDKEEKSISAKDMADELQNADIGDWNNMNQQERDATCKDILEKAEEKYGDKLKDDKFRKEVTGKLTDENFHTMTKVIEEKYGDTDKLSTSESKMLASVQKEENERLEIAKDIAKELYGLNENNATPERIEKEARRILTPQDGEVLEKGEKIFTNSNGEIERGTDSLKKWRDSLKESKEANKPAGQKMADMIKESGVKTFADEIKEQSKDASYYDNLQNYEVYDQADALARETKDYNLRSEINKQLDRIDRANRRGEGYSQKPTNELREILKENSNTNKYEGTKRWGFGWANDDNIPVYQNKIDYSGDFTHANLSSVSNDDLVKIANKQTELYNEAVNRSVGDRRTHNGKMDAIFKSTDTLRYGNGIEKVSQEMEKRGIKTDSQINTALRQKAYQKYLKEHPGSKMSFEDFKDMRK